MSRRTHCASGRIGRSLPDAAPRADPPDLHGVRRLGRASALDRLEPLGLRPLQQAEQGLRLPAELEEAPLLGLLAQPSRLRSLGTGFWYPGIEPACPEVRTPSRFRHSSMLGSLEQLGDPPLLHTPAAQ